MRSRTSDATSSRSESTASSWARSTTPPAARRCRKHGTGKSRRSVNAAELQDGRHGIISTASKQQVTVTFPSPSSALQAFVLAELLDRASVHRLTASFARSAKPSHGSAATQPGGPEVICCPSAIAIAAKRIEPASDKLARPIPVLIRLAPTTGCLTISHSCKWRCVGKIAGQRARQDSNPRPAA